MALWVVVPGQGVEAQEQPREEEEEEEEQLQGKVQWWTRSGAGMRT